MTRNQWQRGHASVLDRLLENADVDFALRDHPEYGFVTAELYRVAQIAMRAREAADDARQQHFAEAVGRGDPQRAGVVRAHLARAVEHALHAFERINDFVVERPRVRSR
jgi:hypothetical protein